MEHQRTISEAEAEAIAALAELPPAPERRSALAALLPAFRGRCAKLYAADVEGFEFDFLRPRE